MISSRKYARYLIFCSIYEADVNKSFNIQAVEDLISLNKIDEDVIELKSDDIEFIKKYTVKIIENLQIIDENISENMTGWKIDRLGALERSLLRIATYEILFEENIAYKIAINEVVELAKKYGDFKSYEFINGVLALIVKNNNK